MTLEEMKKVFYEAVMTALGKDPSFNYRRNKPPVRISYPPYGQPDWTIKDDVVFISINFVSDETTQPVHERYKATEDGEKLIRTHYSNQVVQVMLTAYGPLSFDNLLTIRHHFYDGSTVLEKADFKIILSEAVPSYVPELFQDMWWPRSDLTLTFNHTVSYDESISYIQEVPIHIKDNPGTSTKVIEEQGDVGPSGIIIKKG